MTFKEKLKNFARGMGSVIDIMPDNPTPDIEESVLDASAEDALRGDMERIGGDFRVAVGQYEQESRDVPQEEAPARLAAR